MREKNVKYEFQSVLQTEYGLMHTWFCLFTSIRSNIVPPPLLDDLLWSIAYFPISHQLENYVQGLLEMVLKGLCIVIVNSHWHNCKHLVNQ